MPAIVLEYVLEKNGMTVGKDVFIDTTMQFAAMPGPSWAVRAIM